MKKNPLLGACLAMLLLPVASRADFLYDFNDATPTNGGGVAFASQDGWVINETEPAHNELSFLIPVAGYGQSVGLGGLRSQSNIQNVELTRPVTDTESGVSIIGKTFEADFGIVNTYNDNPNPGLFPFYPDSYDSFALILRGTNGFSYELNLDDPNAPDGDFSSLRDVSMTGLTTSEGIITTGDYSAPALYEFSIAFSAAPDGNIEYLARLVSGAFSSSYNGTLNLLDVGDLTSLTTIGAAYRITAADLDFAGSNFMLLDNLSLADTPPPVPEAGSAALGMLAMGALVMRRRRNA